MTVKLTFWERIHWDLSFDQHLACSCNILNGDSDVPMSQIHDEYDGTSNMTVNGQIWKQVKVQWYFMNNWLMNSHILWLYHWQIVTIALLSRCFLKILNQQPSALLWHYCLYRQYWTMFCNAGQNRSTRRKHALSTRVTIPITKSQCMTGNWTRDLRGDRCQRSTEQIGQAISLHHGIVMMLCLPARSFI